MTKRTLETIAKHGVPFEIAIDALDDPHGLISEDFVDDNGEVRYQAVCMFEGILNLIAFAYRQIEGLETAWIISIRKAVNYEQEKYFKR